MHRWRSVFRVRKSTVYLMLTFAGAALLFFSIFIHPLAVSGRVMEEMDRKRALVRKLMITDLCLFTEASYTRHISLADLHTPFQDHPMSLEHFPTGSIVMPPLAFQGETGP